MSTPIARDARRLLQHGHHGVLSTLSLDVPGYPFGSIVTYSLDALGQPVLLLSGIAQHTANIRADGRVSLTIAEPSDDPQAAARLTLLADAELITDAATSGLAARYVRRFPASARYHEAHDFDYYRLKLVRARYIGGFGRIHWVPAEEMQLVNPFVGDHENGMVAHMNDDHVEAMRDFFRMNRHAVADDAQPQMTGIDPEGCDLLLGTERLRMDFEARATTPGQVRQAMVALARRARAATDPAVLAA